MSAETPEYGEIWEDGEGVLMVCIKPALDGTTCWLGMGTAQPIRNDDVLIVHPLRRVFDLHGNFVLEGGPLRYLNGSNIGPSEALEMAELSEDPKKVKARKAAVALRDMLAVNTPEEVAKAIFGNLKGD